jgi:hypothetical protein
MNPRLLRPLATGFNPKSIANLGLWLDASVTSSLTLNGNTVSQWSDLSGNGRHAVMATAAVQPDATTRTQNGLRVLDFDGSKGMFVHSASGGVTNLTGAAIARNVPGVTIIAACAFDTSSGTQFLFNANTNTQASRSAIVLTGGNILAGGRRLNADAFASVQYAHNSNANIISGVLDYANSDAFIYQNGALQNSSSSFQTDGNSQNGDSTSVEVGSTGNGTISRLDGFIGELLVFQRALSATERLQVERYLGRKWGITVA